MHSGSGLLGLKVGGGVWRAWDQGVFSVGEGPAYEPWKDWRKTGNDAPLALVRAAILAASPHNTQPWLFNAIPRRHTNRGAYDPLKAISPDFIDTLNRLPSDYADVKLFLFTAEADRKKIVEISSVANAEIYSDRN